MGDERTAEQYREDMIRYGACPVCHTAIMVRERHDERGGITLSMVCPRGDHG